MALDLLVEKVKHGIATLAVLPGVALQVEPLWVPSASLIEEVVCTPHGFLLGVGDVNRFPLLAIHDITRDALRLPGRLIAPVRLGRPRRIRFRGRPSLGLPPR